MKFHITKFRTSSFEGNVLDENLPQKYKDLLEVDPNQELTNEIKFEGEYSVEWDDDIPMPIVDSLWLDNGNKSVDVNLDDLGNELFELEEQISQSGYDGDWEADRIASIGDAAYDRWKEEN